MSTTETFQIPLEAAEAYEATFVPNMFAAWAPRTLDAAGVGPGQRVLDVACGTGIVARTAAGVVGPDGEVVGVDANEAMLTVARRVAPDLRWQQGLADDLPFDDDAFDAVTCQMALMFFPDPGHAFAEMRRVARPGARVGVVVPAALHAQPAYRTFVDVVVAHAGDEARPLLSSYWSCGDPDELAGWMRAGGLLEPASEQETRTARFGSVEHFTRTEVESTPLVERMDDATYTRVRAAVADAMAGYTTAQGFAVPLACLVASARVP